MPSPLSVTTISTCDSTATTRTSTRPPLGVNLIALESRFHTTCWSRVGSPASCGTGPMSADELDALGLGREPDGVERGLRDGGHVDGAHLDLELSGDDPGDVEQILDELRLRGGVALDGLQGAAARGLVELAHAEQARPAQDGVERGAQLVRERGQELVLDPVDALGLAVEARVVQGERRGVPELPGQRGVVRAEGARRLGGDEREDARLRGPERGGGRSPPRPPRAGPAARRTPGRRRRRSSGGSPRW